MHFLTLPFSLTPSFFFLFSNVAQSLPTEKIFKMFLSSSLCFEIQCVLTFLKGIFYMQLVHALMEAEKSHDVPSASCRPQKTSSVAPL